MDEETPWILKMLSERKISARSAGRILRALDILNETEKRQAAGSSAAAPVSEKQPDTSEPQQESGIDETAIWAEIEAIAEEIREAEICLEAEIEVQRKSTVSTSEDQPDTSEPQQESGIDETAIWAEIEAIAEEMREAETCLEAEIETGRESAIAQEADLRPVGIEATAEVEEERGKVFAESKSDILDGEQEAVEEVPESTISDDLERPTKTIEPIQEPQSLPRESVRETEEPSSESHIAEEKFLPTEKMASGKEEKTFAEELTSEDAPITTVEEEPSLAQEAETEGEIEPRFAEASANSEIAWTEISNKLMEDDGSCVIVGIPSGIGVVIEKTAGNARIQSWDQPHVRIEGDEDSFTVLQAENAMKIKSESDLVLYTPPSIGKITVDSDSGQVNIEKHFNDVVVNSHVGDVNIKGVDGTIRVTSIEGSIALEACRNRAWLESSSGHITVRGAGAIQIDNGDGIINLGESLDHLVKGEEESGSITIDIPELNIETHSGSISLTDINGDIDAKSSGGKITIERCRGRSISLESNGGSIELRDVANDMDLKSENGNILVEDFLGRIDIQVKDADVSLRKSGDAEIHIESDGGSIEIEDCYADAYVNSGEGNISVSGGSLSFGGMGKVDLKMESGNAYLRRRTFEDVRIAIGNGDAELNMEKLSSGGSGRISVYRGNITVRVSPEFQCEVIAHALRKRIHMDLPVKVVEKDKNQMRGMLNGGGSKIELIAPDGEITLQAL